MYKRLYNRITNRQSRPTALLEKTFGFRLPDAMLKEFENLVKKHEKQLQHPHSADELNDFFCKEYIDNIAPFELTTINFEKEFVNTEQERLHCTAAIKNHGNHHAEQIKGYGNGALDALANAFKAHHGIELEVVDYLQHGLTQGSHALAASYIQLAGKNGTTYWGAGIDSDCTLSAVRALLSAVNRSQR